MQNLTKPATLRSPIGSDVLEIVSSIASTALRVIGAACASSLLASKHCTMVPAIRLGPVSHELAFIEGGWEVTCAALMELSALVAGAQDSFKKEQ